MSDFDPAFEQSVEPSFMPPYRYPAWLVGFAIVIVFVVAYSVILVPKYYMAAKLLDEAVNADQSGHSGDSIQLLLKANKLVPGSKKIALQAAYELFKQPDEQSHADAMGVLSGISMDKDEWNRIRSVMPSQYLDKFQATER